MISTIAPLSLLLASVFFFAYFIWSVTKSQKLRAKATTSDSCGLTLAQINARYTGDICGIIISFIMMLISGWLLFTTAKENGIVNSVANKAQLLRSRRADI